MFHFDFCHSERKANAAMIASEQENPSLKYATASSILVIGRILFPSLDESFRRYMQ